MNLKSKNLNWGALSAVIALVGIAAFDLLAPKPGGGATAPKKSVTQLRAEKDAAMAKLEQARGSVTSQTWQVALDEVGPEAMAWVSRQAQANYLTVSAFRPQRTLEVDGVAQLNYLVTTEGPFLNVMRFIDAFEAEDSLLAVKAVQLASADGATDTVRATIGLVAYKEAKSGG